MPTNPKQFETAIGALMPGGWPKNEPPLPSSKVEYKWIRLGVCGKNSHQMNLGNQSEEAHIKFGNTIYTIEGCGLCVDDKIRELRGYREQPLPKR